MGKPGWSNVQSSATESIGCGSETRGSETSQYPQEKKSTEIPLLKAIERGIGQTESPYESMGRCGVLDSFTP